MAGITCGERYVVDHGGFGTNPIWRLQLWGGKKIAPKLLRVSGIDRDGIELPCFDLETDDHYVWLPEADWTTSQCDDQVILVGSLCAAIGFKVGARAWGKGASGEYQHVYPVVLVPKGGPWPRGYYGTGLDTTVPRFDVGDEPEGGHILTAWLRGD
jgi:hypothetical protein